MTQDEIDASYRAWYCRTWPHHILAAPAPYFVYPPGNALLTIDMITREALRLFNNSNWFLRTITRDFDEQFAAAGAKIGAQLRIRLPNEYVR